MQNNIGHAHIFDSYEEYIKKQITPTDLFYIEDEELLFEIFTLGLKSRGILSKEDFNSTYKKKKKNEKISMKEENKECITYDINILYNGTKDFFYIINYHIHFCKENKIATILFIRYLNKSKSEISSYIDINNNKVIEKIKKKKYIYASKRDLSYYNWKNNYISTNNNENYEIIINKKIGLIFKHRNSKKYFMLNSNKQLKINLCDNIYKDNIKINFDENEKIIKLCGNIKKIELEDPNYLQCLLYTLPL
ncbi:conserved Plasmodium protein, unknown function [Plasmodium relictum]|uniref:Cilia- and flagella-associated protein 299 n=1 Tax=Plasmodium relictum TaxID=85471 RepID=A0A1J1H462_PLARL|nr:conserved Plasmodium protein, unknown function [Plasmodium relictum]CRG99530.1 conserved Plasmodium protein, unknown function [Plasmodium relictum]